MTRHVSGSITKGWEIDWADGEMLGRVSEVDGEDVIVATPVGDLAIPRRAVAFVDLLSARARLEEGWPEEARR